MNEPPQQYEEEKEREVKARRDTSDSATTRTSNVFWAAPIELDLHGAMDLICFRLSGRGDRSLLYKREDQIRSLARRTAQDIVQIGIYLIEVKEHIGHGKFLEWIGAAFQWREQTARNFMNVANHFKSPPVGDLKIEMKPLSHRRTLNAGAGPCRRHQTCHRRPSRLAGGRKSAAC